MLCVSALMVLVLIGGRHGEQSFKKLYNAIIAYLNLEASLKSWSQCHGSEIMQHFQYWSVLPPFECLRER